MTTEREELVTDFGALRVFDRVVVRPCRWHSPPLVAGHRYALLKLVALEDVRKDSDVGTVDYGVGWELLPKPRCHWTTNARLLTPDAVRERRVFRIVDEDGIADAEAATRLRELVRAR